MIIDMKNAIKSGKRKMKYCKNSICMLRIAKNY